MQKFDTVVVSDLHLGARNARTDDFLTFLSSLRTDRLVLAGDFFDSPQLRGLTTRHVKVLDSLRQLSRRAEVIWIRGNHDPNPEWFTAIFDLQLRDEMLLDVAERKYLVCHGHLWDKALNWPWWIVYSAEAVYRACQVVDRSHLLARYLKRKSKWFCKVVDGLRTKSVSAARHLGYDGVIVGHSHVASDMVLDGVHYVNCGCWTERPAGFVGIRRGEVRHYHWESDQPQAAEPAPAPARLPSRLASGTVSAMLSLTGLRKKPPAQEEVEEELELV